MKMEILNREVCVCALLFTKLFIQKKQRRKEDTYELL